ncbi:MAG: GNAT family N-acetyltransferase [Hyphomonadaceae bacterium]
MADKVRLERGEPHQKAALANLIQLYIHDFNDFLAPERKIGVEEDGRFADVLQLERYWTEADRAVWFIRAGGQLAGFALLNKASHCGRAVDFNMGEFFVARPFRRDGIGARAAVDVIEMHKGQWEIAIGERNLPAKAFWPRVVAAANVSDVETLAGDGVTWTGPILRCCVT